VPALSTLMAGLHADLDAAILVVLHVPANGRSVLPDILERAGGLFAAHPRDREPIVAGHIYVAPPDRHLIVHDRSLRVTRGAWENGYRPSIDALFRSAAHWYGSAVIGVVLSGALDDGAAGLASIHDGGGIAIVQDPSDATVRDMPDHALVTVPTARVLPAREIATTINRITMDASDLRSRPARVLTRDVSEDPDLAAAQGIPIEIEDVGPTSPAGLVCPDCGGSMFDVGPDDPGRRYRCRRLVDRAVQNGREQVARRVAARQEQRDRLASMLRAAIEQFGSIAPGNDGETDACAPTLESGLGTDEDDEAVL
jgi:two-component system chemotaxis response regulator CheB